MIGKIFVKSTKVTFLILETYFSNILFFIGNLQRNEIQSCQFDDQPVFTKPIIDYEKLADSQY